jgi:hypothetical protein
MAVSTAPEYPVDNRIINDPSRNILRSYQGHRNVQYTIGLQTFSIQENDYIVSGSDNGYVSIRIVYCLLYANM